MKITRIDVDPNNAQVEHEPILRFSPHGGCSLPGCSCSPIPFLLISDSEVALSVQLDLDEVAALCSGEIVEIR